MLFILTFPFLKKVIEDDTNTSRSSCLFLLLACKKYSGKSEKVSADKGIVHLSQTSAVSRSGRPSDFKSSCFVQVEGTIKSWWRWFDHTQRGSRKGSDTYLVAVVERAELRGFPLHRRRRFVSAMREVSLGAALPSSPR